MSQFHGLPHTGHLGHDGTYICLRQHFYWPGIFKDVGKWIASCLPCQQRKTSKQNRYGQHRSVLQTRPFEVVSIDLVGPFEPTPEGHKFIINDHRPFHPLPHCSTNQGQRHDHSRKSIKNSPFHGLPLLAKKNYQ